MKIPLRSLKIIIPLMVLVGIIYRLFQQVPYLLIPVVFNSSNIPCIEGSLEKKSYFFKIDLGSAEEINLNENLIEKVKNKVFYRTSNTLDLKGNSYRENSYLIPRFQIGKLKFSNVCLKGESSQFGTKTARETSPQEEMGDFLLKSDQVRSCACDVKEGRIGISLLHRVNLLLDFPNSRLFVCQPHLHSPQHILATSFSSHAIAFDFHDHRSIIFPIETDLGILRFILDTGCTVSMIKSSLVGRDEASKERRWPFFTSSKFTIGSHSFSPKRLYLYEFGDRFSDFDGILGMDFLKDHPVFIDFSLQLIQFGTSAP